MRILVTGHSGFVGQHLVARHPGCELVLPDEGFDLRHAESLLAVLARERFDHVIHLAAQANVAASLADPLPTLDVNFLGTVRLLEALKAIRFSGRLLYVSSGDVYGIVDSNALPVTEATPVRPANPYAVSKVSAEVAALSWGRSSGYEVMVARPFNHIGPGQGPGFAIGRFADALARMKLGLVPPVLTTGRLDVTRDFLDVRDVVESYFRLLASGVAGETYNVCSGTERRLEDVLDELILLSGLSITRTLDPALMRPADLPRMVGDASKLRRDTGWSPIIPFSQTLQDVLSHALGAHEPR